MYSLSRRRRQVAQSLRREKERAERAERHAQLHWERLSGDLPVAADVNAVAGAAPADAAAASAIVRAARPRPRPLAPRQTDSDGPSQLVLPRSRSLQDFITSDSSSSSSSSSSSDGPTTYVSRGDNAVVSPVPSRLATPPLRYPDDTVHTPPRQRSGSPRQVFPRVGRAGVSPSSDTCLTRGQIAQRLGRQEERAARNDRQRLSDDDRPTHASREDNAVATPVPRLPTTPTLCYPDDIVHTPSLGPRQRSGSLEIIPRRAQISSLSDTYITNGQIVQRFRRQRGRAPRAAAQQRLSDDRPTTHEENVVASPVPTVPTPALCHPDDIVRAVLPRETRVSPLSDAYLTRRQVAQRLRRQKERAARNDSQRLSDHPTHLSHEPVAMQDNAVASHVPTPTLRSAILSSMKTPSPILPSSARV